MVVAHLCGRIWTCRDGGVGGDGDGSVGVGSDGGHGGRGRIWSCRDGGGGGGCYT